MRVFWLVETFLVLLSLNFIDAAHAIRCGNHVSLLWTGWSVKASAAADVWLGCATLLNLITALTASRSTNTDIKPSGANKYIWYRGVLTVVVLMLRLTVGLGWVTGCVHSIPVVFAAVVVPFRLTEHTVNTSLMYKTLKTNKTLN